MYRTLHFAILATILSLGTATATPRDLIIPGTKGLGHTHSFVGMEAFPEHQFLIVPDVNSPWQNIAESGAYSWYKLASVRVYATPHDFVLPTKRSQDRTLLAGFPKSSIELNVESSVPVASPADTRRTIYRIASVAGGLVELELLSDDYFDASGARLSDTEASGAAPYIRAAAGSGVILLVLLFLFLRRRQNHIQAS